MLYDIVRLVVDCVEKVYNYWVDDVLYMLRKLYRGIDFKMLFELVMRLLVVYWRRNKDFGGI